MAGEQGIYLSYVCCMVGIMHKTTINCSTGCTGVWTGGIPDAQNVDW